MKSLWIVFFISLPLRVLTINGFFQKKEKNVNKERSFGKLEDDLMRIRWDFCKN